MKQIYSYDSIISLKISTKIEELNDFVTMYQGLIDEDNVKPLFSQTYKYDLFPKKKIYKRLKIKNKNAWTPNIPKTNIEKINKTIKIILNKITEKNYNTLIETLVCEINKFNTSDVLEILTHEIIKKIIFDKNFHNIYIKLCNRIWSMKSWHEDLVTIVVDEDNKLYWHKNSNNEDDVKLNGPHNSEQEIREYTNKYINFKYILFDTLQDKFNEIDQNITKSNEANIDEDVRYKYRRNIFSIVEFIGKLYKKNMISEKIIHICLIELLNYHKQKDKLYEEYIEAFCILWKILDEKIISPIKPNLADEYFDHINKNIMTQPWSKRIKFMLENINELYKKKYKCFSKPKLVNHQSQKVKNFTDIKFTRSSEFKLVTRKKIKIKVESSDSDNDSVGSQDSFEQIENLIYNFKKDKNYDKVASKLGKYKKYIDDMLDLIVYSSLEEINQQKLYAELIKNCKFPTRKIMDALSRSHQNLDDIILDIPNAKNNLLSFVILLNNSMGLDLNDTVIKRIIFYLTS